MKKIKKYIKGFFLRKGYLLARSVSKNQLGEFFKLIKPVQTEHKLLRIGGNGDGGYLIPDDIEGISMCFSPGVSTVANFEMEMVGRGMVCALADYSVDGPPISDPSLRFIKKFIGQNNDEVHITLQNWIDSFGPHLGDLMLQMDIEGAEYQVLLDADVELLKKFRIIIIEFHDLNALISEFGFNLINTTFRKLLKDFDLIHIHPNNCTEPVEIFEYLVPPVMEFTFLRKDRSLIRTANANFPNQLDRPNVVDELDFPLPPCWYK